MNTNATNHTQFFGFPLFVNSDKPSVLTDWNGTMEELDRVLEDYRVRIAGCEQTTASFMDQVNIIKGKLDEINTRFSADEQLIADNSLEISALKEAMVVADTSIKRILTTLGELEPRIMDEVNDALDEVNGQITTINETLQTLTNNYNQLSGRLLSLGTNTTSSINNILYAIGTEFSSSFGTYKKNSIVYDRICAADQNATLYIATEDTDSSEGLQNGKWKQFLSADVKGYISEILKALVDDTDELNNVVSRLAKDSFYPISFNDTSEAFPSTISTYLNESSYVYDGTNQVDVLASQITSLKKYFITTGSFVVSGSKIEDLNNAPNSFEIVAPAYVERIADGNRFKYQIAITGKEDFIKFVNPTLSHKYTENGVDYYVYNFAINEIFNQGQTLKQVFLIGHNGVLTNISHFTVNGIECLH